MKIFTLLIIIFVSFSINIFAQYSREKALENPLECALYLLSKDKDAVETLFLPKELIKLGRYDDAIFVIELRSYDKVELFTYLGKELIEANNLSEANRFLTKALNILRVEKEWWSRNSKTLVSNLVQVDRLTDALEILSHQEDDEYKVGIQIAIAETYFKLGEKENAEKFIDEAFEHSYISKNKDYMHWLINLLVQNKSAEKANEYLAKFETEIKKNKSDEDLQREMIIFLPYLYFQLGQKEKAFEIISEYKHTDDLLEVLNIILMLLKNNDKENAVLLFHKIKLNQDKSSDYGKTLVEIYLQLNDIKSAINIANEMSEDVDNYQQQGAFMLIADKLITDRNTDEALNLLKVAYQRAEKVGEVHETQDSIGASSLTRKIIYLRNIKHRYFKLNRFDDGLAVINAVKIRERHYQEFYSNLIMSYVNEQIKFLSLKEVGSLLEKAENIFDEDQDYYRMQAQVSIAEVYAKLGEKTKAVELLAKVLEEAQESCCYDDVFLLLAGKVFDEYKLTTNEKMKSILREYIESVEN